VLLVGLCLALQGCFALPGTSGDFRPVPGTNSDGTPPLKVNADSHFQGHIAFVRDHHLYVLDGATGTVHILPAGSNVQDPAYSPDGTRLAYVSRGAGWSDIMVMAASGGAPFVLTHNQGKGAQITCSNGVSETDAVLAANPVWAMDGKSLYYLSDEQKLKLACGFADMAIWKIALQGGERSLVIWPAGADDESGAPGAGGDAYLSLRPGTSNEMTYTHYAYDATQGDGTPLVQVFLAILDQQQEVALTPTVSNDGSALQAMEASWSPDGHELAYISHTGGAYPLAVMHVSDPPNGEPDFGDYASSTNLSLAGAIDYPVSYPTWSPDGKSLLYLEYRNNEYNLYLMQLAVNGTRITIQGSPIQLTEGGVDGDSRPSWTSA
jgi:Tol biopolymer transport system component